MVLRLTEGEGDTVCVCVCGVLEKKGVYIDNHMSENIDMRRKATNMGDNFITTKEEMTK